MRSLLFVPGNKYDWIVKSLNSNADGIVIDLEDAVAAENKEYGRQTVKKFFEQIEADNRKIIVRINSLKTSDGLRDVLILKECKRLPYAVMLPKTESVGEIELLADLLAEIKEKTIQIFAIIESVKGILRANEIAASNQKVIGLLFGGGDYSSDLGCEFTWENLFYARQAIVTAAANAHVEAIDVPYILLDDLDGLEAETKKIALMGFTGKTAIHPKQIEIINKVFLPGPEQVNWANRVLEAVNKQGSGAIRLDGKMVDAAIVRRAHKIIRAAGEQVLC